VNEVFARLDQFFDSANLFYEQLGFHGLLKFDFKIDGLSNYKLNVGREEYLSTMETEVIYNITCISSELKLRKREFISTAIKNLGWTYNTNFNDEYLKSIDTK
jgi:hypothetical protein